MAFFFEFGVKIIKDEPKFCFSHKFETGGFDTHIFVGCRDVAFDPPCPHVKFGRSLPEEPKARLSVLSFINHLNP